MVSNKIWMLKLWIISLSPVLVGHLLPAPELCQSILCFFFSFFSSVKMLKAGFSRSVVQEFHLMFFYDYVFQLLSILKCFSFRQLFSGGRNLVYSRFFLPLLKQTVAGGEQILVSNRFLAEFCSLAVKVLLRLFTLCADVPCIQRWFLLSFKCGLNFIFILFRVKHPKWSWNDCKPKFVAFNLSSMCG